MLVIPKRGKQPRLIFGQTNRSVRPVRQIHPSEEVNERSMCSILNDVDTLDYIYSLTCVRSY
jgi:hypothetical protein